MDHQLETLKNGMNTLFVNLPGSTAGSVQIWFRAGSALEQKENQGIAHFLEHMFFKGTAKRPGAQIARAVESYGGEINAFTSFDYTCYYINSPNNFLIDSTEILLDMVSNPLFDESELVPERDVVFEEYRRSQDNPSHYSFHRIQENFFEGNYSHPVLGREQTIKNFKRNQLVHFRSSYYNKQNALFVVAGDLKQKKALIEKVEKFNLPEGKTSVFPPFKLKQTPLLDFHKKEVRMATLSFTIQAPNMTKFQSPAEDLAVNCLGHGESSRLHKALVLDKGLANSVAASTMFMNDGGLHFFKVTFPLENFDKVLSTLKKVLQDSFKKGFLENEIQKIKNHYLAAKIYEKETVESFSFSLGHSYAQSGDIHAEDDFISRVRDLSQDDVNSALSSLLEKPIHIQLQAPQDTPESNYQSKLKTFQKSLKFKAPVRKKQTKLQLTKSNHDPCVQIYEIKKGLKLIYRQNKINPTSVFQAYLRGGLSYEKSKTKGAFYFLSQMLTKGYGKFNEETIKEIFESHSAQFSGFSGKNAYGLSLHCLSEDLTNLLPHFFNSLLKPKMSQKDLNQEKTLAQRSLESQKEDPVRLCFQAASELFFKDHPYRYNVLGDASSHKNIKSTMLKELHQKHLNRQEIVLTYCGDKSFRQIVDLLKPWVDSISAKKATRPKGHKKSPHGKEKIFIELDREQTQIFYGFSCPGLGHKDNTFYKMISTYLSGQSSPLFVEVRDRQGLCYATQPVHFSALEAGYFGIYMASGHDKVDAALKAIKGLIQDIAQGSIDEAEFERIKKMIDGQTLLNIQTNEDFSNIYSAPVLQGLGLDYFYRSHEQVKKLSFEEFKQSTQKLTAKKWSTILVGRKS